MSTFQWAMFALAAIGCIVTVVGSIVAITRGFEGLRQEFEKKIDAEKIARANELTAAIQSRNKEMDELRREFAENQLTQDRNTGEMGNALRSFIKSIEDSTHRAELWGRDHYVQKEDFRDAIDKIDETIRSGNADLKADLKTLQARIEQRNN